MNEPNSPLADTRCRIEGGYGSRSARRWRHALGSLRRPSSDGARRVVEQVNDLGDLRSHIALAIGHDKALQKTISTSFDRKANVWIRVP